MLYRPFYWPFNKIKIKNMKKVLYSLLAVTFAGSMLAAVVFAEESSSNTPNQRPMKTSDERSASVTQNTEGLEKISNPEMIRYYESIRKIGNSLWGKRRTNISGTAEKNRQNTEKKPASSTNSRKLEKIKSPSEIKNYQEIRKIESSLWGIKKDSSGKKEEKNEEEVKERKPEVKKSEKESVFVKPEAAQCVKTAIDKKDASLKASMSSQNVLALAAVDARNTCQKAALDKTTLSEQAQSNKSCLESYHQAVWDSLNVLKQSKENSWKTYTDDLKACANLQREINTTTSEEKIVIEDGEMQINLKAETEESTEK